MSDVAVAARPRRSLNPRQVETVEKLLTVGEAELEEMGPQGLTIRSVAEKAGVSSATAYNYFASKDHLFAEVFWRRLDQIRITLPPGTALERVLAVIDRLLEMLAASPHLATAANLALLGEDPEVARLRIRIGATIVNHFVAAVGPHADAALIDALTYTFSGGLLQAGMGLMSYQELGDRLSSAVAVILEKHT